MVHSVTFILSTRGETVCFVLQKSLFRIAKQALFMRKTYAFGKPDNTFCNTLMKRWLCNRNFYKKYLRFYGHT